MPSDRLERPIQSSAPRQADEPILLTPGPLTTAAAVKTAMLRDWGSWDSDFRAMTADVRKRLIDILPDNQEQYDCVPMQGSGTFVVESMLGTFLPPGAKTLVLSNGAYGKRTAETLQYLGRPHTLVDKGDYMPPRAEDVQSALAADPDISHIVLVHCETSSGILNPVEEIADVASSSGRRLLIDSMSGFGALPLSPEKTPFDALASSANKCLEGVPGMGFIIARKDVLAGSAGHCHSLSLDAQAQWAHMEKTGQWRFTPPTHVVAAFQEALKIHRLEGGRAARLARYARSRDRLVDGMRKIGFETLLKDRWLSPIIVTFFSPSHSNFQFGTFYDLMKEKGFVIYPGKLTIVDSFRIGCIGAFDDDVMAKVVDAARQCLEEMGVDDAAPPLPALAERDKLAA